MAKLNFKQFGQGEALIIMHGLYGSSDNWVSIARELKHNFKVYLVDLRNHGRSPHIHEHDYGGMVDDLQEFMDDQKLYSAIIMGHSMGGKVAMSFAGLFPEKVKKLIVVDISPRTYSVNKGDLQFEEHYNILKSLQSIKLEEVNSREEVNDALAESIPSERIRQFLLKNLARVAGKRFAWRLNVAVLLQSIEHVVEGLEDEYDQLSSFLSPVLFIKGGDSQYINATDEEIIKQVFLNVNIVSIENASHWVHAEQPEEFVKSVIKFLL